MDGPLLLAKRMAGRCAATHRWRVVRRLERCHGWGWSQWHLPRAG